MSRSEVTKTEISGGQKMRGKANASGNAEDRGSRFAPDRKEKQTSLGSYTDETTTTKPKRRQKLDVKRKPDKWSQRTTYGLVTGQLEASPKSC
ncbi:hypothetical protein [Allocoleopsis sp.]|uniref:hypothetical protein n=1 Tax=Allocoleopsis sp. TaxID=3088169 RepID=UPI002FD42B03